MKRRNFVKTLASLAAVGALPGVASAAANSVSEPNSGVRGPAALSPRAAVSNYALQLDGSEVGFLKSFEGGDAVAEIIQEPTGKRLGKLNYEPLTVVLAVPPHTDVTKLVTEAVSGAAGRRTVAIIGYDMNMKAVSGREFPNAVLSEVALDPIKGSAKAAIHLQLTFQPEASRATDKGGATAKLAPKQKAATAFRFAIDGIDSSAVLAVELPVLKRAVSSRPAGADSKSVAAAARPELSSFKVELSMAQAQPWLDWFEQYAILRKDTAERTARLELMAADQQTVLYTVSLAGVGIVALRNPKIEANSDAVARLEATLYAERITYGS